jgi:UDP-glucose 4-epimerase
MVDSQKMRYLITGGAGFIGSHLSGLLTKQGHEVEILDNLSTGSRKNLEKLPLNQGVSFHCGSVLDLEVLEPLVKRVDEVIHLAAAVGVFTILDKPIESLRTNIRGSENVADLCVKYSKPLLVTSTSEIYGKNTNDALTEDDDRILGSPLLSRWSYSEAKAIEEILAFSVYSEFGVPARIIRLFNTVGPDQSGAYGMVIPRFVSAARSGVPIEIYGDGQQTRCFGHVFDVVEAIDLVLKSELTIGEVVNVGNPQEVSILDLAERVIRLLRSSSTLRFVPYEEAYGSGFEDMQRRVPNIQKIRRLTGWSPSRNLDQIIVDTAKSQQNQRL